MVYWVNSPRTSCEPAMWQQQSSAMYFMIFWEIIYVEEDSVGTCVVVGEFCADDSWGPHGCV